MFNFPGQGGQMPSHSLALNPFALPPGMPLDTEFCTVALAHFWCSCRLSGFSVAATAFVMHRPGMQQMAQAHLPVSVSHLDQESWQWLEARATQNAGDTCC